MGRSDPSRYELTGDPPRIICSDWPNVRLHVERGLTVDEDEREQYPRQSVFLDGVFTGPAFLDNEMRQYSLDHHAGCVRAFTLATCEQAVVMLLQGLPPVMCKRAEPETVAREVRLGLDEAPEGYEMFLHKRDGCEKVVLNPWQ